MFRMGRIYQAKGDEWGNVVVSIGRTLFARSIRGER